MCALCTALSAQIRASTAPARRHLISKTVVANTVCNLLILYIGKLMHFTCKVISYVLYTVGFLISCEKKGVYQQQKFNIKPCQRNIAPNDLRV